MNFATRSLSQNRIAFYSIAPDLDTARNWAVLVCIAEGIEPDDTVTVETTDEFSIPGPLPFEVFWPEGRAPFLRQTFEDRYAEFIDFEFAGVMEAKRAEAFFPSSVVNRGKSLALKVTDMTRYGVDLRKDLSAMGLTWREADSKFTRDTIHPRDFDWTWP